MKVAVVVELTGRDLVITGFRSDEDATAWASRVIPGRLRWWLAAHTSAGDAARALGQDGDGHGRGAPLTH